MKIKGMLNTVDLHAVAHGAPFAIGDEVYHRMPATYLRKEEKVNAFSVSSGRLVYLEWGTQVVPLKAKYKTLEEE